MGWAENAKLFDNQGSKSVVSSLLTQSVADKETVRKNKNTKKAEVKKTLLNMRIDVELLKEFQNYCRLNYTDVTNELTKYIKSKVEQTKKDKDKE